MRNLINISTLAFLASLTAFAHALPEAAPAPTLFRRDDEDDRIESSLSDALASATSALADHPEDASSVMSQLSAQYTSIAGEATGCDSRWAQITNAVGEFDDGILDGVRNLADEIFGDDDDDECKRAVDDDDDNEASSARANSVVGFGVAGAALLGLAAVL